MSEKLTPNCELLQKVIPELEKRKLGGGAVQTVDGKPWCAIGHLLDLAGEKPVQPWGGETFYPAPYQMVRELYGIDPDPIWVTNDEASSRSYPMWKRTKAVVKYLRGLCS